ncbi:sensor histidine kinase [Ensifer soli]|uniref:sensor histidine kinase n=1 Tax=Ciceribacter sp. sgz301302 TaxID=3342379 RepID=UPI0035B8CFBE
MLNQALKLIDSFILNAAVLERSDLSVARNFVFTHLFGPFLGQAIVIYLYRTDPDPGIECWTIIVSIWLFWTLPFVLKLTNDLHLSAILSVELLTFTSLFGTFFYGGVSSPFLPWLIVALLLGFFYLNDRPLVIMVLFACNFAGFIAAYLAFGFPEIVPLSRLSSVGWISILSATLYMSWMAIYYSNIMSMRSTVERETELHRQTAEKLREAKKRAESANHSKSIFLAKMSHEFRTPLNAVIGYSELLLEMIEPSTATAQKQEDLRRINAAGKHLLSLVTDVLDLSKIESDTIELKAEPFSLDDFCEQVTATIQPLVESNKNTLSVQRPARIGTMVGDQTKLRQVVVNLLSNAAKFTREGTVTLIVKRQKIASSDWIEMTVRDTGIGIPADDLPRLFQDFQQVTGGNGGKYGGTGLGLAISQKLCTLMGGGITVISELGKGSSFTVRIPAAAPDAAPATDERYAADPLSTLQFAS